MPSLTVLQVLEWAEGFIAEELEAKKNCFLPNPDRDQAEEISDAQEVLDAIGEAVARETARKQKRSRRTGATPDLLKALKRAETKLSAYVGVCKDDKELTHAILPMVRAAIAKAESTL